LRIRAVVHGLLGKPDTTADHRRRFREDNRKKSATHRK
jgi:hypothetical protein